jgi:translation initiation factor IF-3
MRAVDPNGKPPVCTLQRYSKLAMAKEKKQKLMKMQQKSLKEMHFSVSMSDIV